MDWTILEDAGVLLMKIKMYPYFDIAHYILMCLVVRDDINQLQGIYFEVIIKTQDWYIDQSYIGTSPYFTKKHPLACWLSSMLTCFGGGILAHFLLGEPILEDFKNHQGLLTATIIW
jgi:trimeric intracellular cation channel